jgi:hypothetical protein
MTQSHLSLLLRLEADEAKLAELAIFGELQAAVSQCAEGGEQLPEPLLLHLEQKGRGEGQLGVPLAKVTCDEEVASKPGPGSDSNTSQNLHSLH